MKRPLWTLRMKLYKNHSIPTYFEIGKKYLDVNTMRYRLFGAVWQLHDGNRYITGFWFGDNKKNIMNLIKMGGWKNLVNHEGQIEEVYHVIREGQERELWEKRMKLPDYVQYQENWREKRVGWYIIRSSKHFPCIMTCIQKTKYNIWIEHVCICESNNDIKKFINLINLEHHISLIPGEIIHYGCFQGDSSIKRG